MTSPITSKGSQKKVRQSSVSEIKKLFVGPDGKVNYTCPQCGRTKAFDVSKYFNIDKEIRLKSKCSCGYQDRILVERRESFRKNTRMSGVYLHEKKTDVKEIAATGMFRKRSIDVINLSSTGLRFRIMDRHYLKVGDIGIAEFVLNDKHRSLISQKVEIKNVNGNEIGARFCLIDPTIGDFRNINFYLFNE